MFALFSDNLPLLFDVIFGVELEACADFEFGIDSLSELVVAFVLTIVLFVF